MGEPDGSGEHFIEVEEAELSSDDNIAGETNGEDSVAGHVGGASSPSGHASVSGDSGSGSSGDSSESGSEGGDVGDGDHAVPDGDDDDEEEYQIEEGESGGDEFDEQGKESPREEAVLEEQDVSDADSSSDGGGIADGGANDSLKDADDSDSASEAVRRPKRGSTSFKIPDEMRDNAGDFFRRSRRQSVAPDRFTAGSSPGSSDGGADEDSDFDAGGQEEDDASDFEYSDGASKSAPRRPKAKTRRKQVRKAARDDDGDAVMPPAAGDESSGSDGDWANGAASDKRRGRRKPKRRARPALRASEDDEDNDPSRTMRINSRTGGAVNYAEAGEEDSDILNEEDAAALKAAEAAAANPDPNVPRIELICDYRVPGAEHSDADAEGKSGRKMPLADFDPDKVEFFIKWIGKSFRRNTWNTLEDLRHTKGFKKLTNYCKKTLEIRQEILASRGTSEEWEDAAVLASENRDALLEFTHIDRIIDERDSTADGDEVTEYLVKWRNLQYKDATWEPASALQSESDLKCIDWYSDRLQAARTESAQRFNPFGKEPRPKFRRMTSQPDYLHGEGRTLREYQLAGLNWLAFSWTNSRNVILADEMGMLWKRCGLCVDVFLAQTFGSLLTYGELQLLTERISRFAVLVLFFLFPFASRRAWKDCPDGLAFGMDPIRAQRAWPFSRCCAA